MNAMLAPQIYHELVERLEHSPYFSFSIGKTRRLI